MSENKNTKTSADGGTGFNYFRASTITVLRQALVDADDTSQKRVDETAKCKHEWVGLTDEEVKNIVREAAKGSATKRDGSTSHRIAQAIEAKLKEKNHG
jgi:hypothetical protein